jgi:hypothetical protein
MSVRSSRVYNQQVVQMICTVEIALCAGRHLYIGWHKAVHWLGHSRLCSRADRQRPGKFLH